MKKISAIAVAAVMAAAMSMTAFADAGAVDYYKNIYTASNAAWANVQHEANVANGFDNAADPVKSKIKETKTDLTKSTGAISGQDSVKYSNSQWAAAWANAGHDMSVAQGFDNAADPAKSKIKETKDATKSTAAVSGKDSVKYSNSQWAAAMANVTREQLASQGIGNGYVGK